MPDLVFPDMWHLNQFLVWLEADTLRACRFHGEGGSGRTGQCRVTVPEGPDMDAAGLQLEELGGRLLETRPVDGGVPAVVWWRKLPLQPTLSPAHFEGRLLVLVPRGEPGLLGFAADRLASMVECSVTTRPWAADEQEWAGFLVEANGAPQRLPDIRASGVHVLQTVANLRDVFVPVGHRHPMPWLGEALLDQAASRGGFLVRLGPRTLWRSLRPRGHLVSLAGAIRGRDLVPTEVPDAAEPEGAEGSRLDIPLAFVRAESRRDDSLDVGGIREIAARILLVEEFPMSVEDVLPSALLALMDRAQAGLDEMRYMRVPRGEGRYQSHRGARHYVWVKGESVELENALCDAQFILPASFERHGLPLYVQAGFRFRPDVAVIIDGGLGAEALTLQLKEQFEIDDTTFAVVVGPGPDPFQPRAQRLPRGPHLDEAITAVFRTWTPLLEKGVEQEIKAAESTDAKDLHEALRSAMADEQAAILHVLDLFHRELEIESRKMDEMLLRARAFLQSVVGVDQAVTDALQRVVRSWDHMVVAVQKADQALSKRIARWRESRTVEIEKTKEKPTHERENVDQAVESVQKAVARLGRFTERLEEIDEQCTDLEKTAEADDVKFSRLVVKELSRVEVAERDAANVMRRVQVHRDKLEIAMRRLETAQAQASSAVADLSARKQREEQAAKDLEATKATQIRIAAEAREAVRRQERARDALKRLEKDIPPLRARLTKVNAEVETLRRFEPEHRALRQELLEVEANLEASRAAQRAYEKQRKQLVGLVREVERVDDAVAAAKCDADHDLGAARDKTMDATRVLAEALGRVTDPRSRAVPLVQVLRRLARLEPMDLEKRSFWSRLLFWRRR